MLHLFVFFFFKAPLSPDIFPYFLTWLLYKVQKSFVVPRMISFSSALTFHVNCGLRRPNDRLLTTDTRAFRDKLICNSKTLLFVNCKAIIWNAELRSNGRKYLGYSKFFLSARLTTFQKLWPYKLWKDIWTANLLTAQIDMSSILVRSVRKLFEMWDVLVVSSVCAGFCCSVFTASTNSSLTFVSLVFLCDLVYITDALARGSKQFRSWTSLGNLLAFFVHSESSSTTLELYTNAPLILSYIPYHFLVASGIEGYGIYMFLCMIRTGLLVKSGRISMNSASRPKKQNINTN